MKSLSYRCVVIFTLLFIMSCSKPTEDLKDTNAASSIIVGNIPADVLGDPPAVTTHTFINHLYGFKVVPTNSSLGHAKLVVKFDGAYTISYFIECDGFVPAGAHIHRGIAIENGPIEFDLGTIIPTKPFEGTVRLNDSQVNDLLGGKLYLDIHSAIFPEGEVRAQIGK